MAMLSIMQLPIQRDRGFAVRGLHALTRMFLRRLVPAVESMKRRATPISDGDEPAATVSTHRMSSAIEEVPP
jgi:hypothetical protein